MDELRRQSLETLMEMDGQLDGAVNGGAFDGFVRDKLFWALSCILQGYEREYDSCLLEDALSDEPDRAEEVMCSMYWPISSTWLDAALQYFEGSKDWNVFLIPTYADVLYSALENEDDLFKPCKDAEGQLQRLEESNFLGFLPSPVRRAILKMHLEEMEANHGWGLFSDDDSDDSCYVLLCSKRLDEYLTLFNGDGGGASELLSSLCGCFDDALLLRGDGVSAVLGTVYTDGYNDLAGIRPRILAVGELLDEAMEEELRKAGGIPSEKGEAS